MLWFLLLAQTFGTPVIDTVTPTEGRVGTTMTVSGNNFGYERGTTVVWIGTKPGDVVSWGETQIIARPAANADSGHAQVLQDGVWGNSVPFTVVGGPPHVLTISPSTAAPGTVVTISGTAFGVMQGSGTVTVSGDTASVRSWSDTAIAIVVPPNALTGIIKVQQNGKWSNAATFRAAGGGMQPVTLNPHVLGLVVGQSRSLQALDPRGGAVRGLSWRSSDPNIVSLSSDDPPVLKALAAGHVTVTAGGASCDITVYGRQ